MDKTRRVIVVVVVVVGVLLAAFGLITDDRKDAVLALEVAVALLAGALIYLLAIDDYQVRAKLFGSDANRRDGRPGPSDDTD